MTHKLIDAVYKDLVYNPAINARGDAASDIAELIATIRAEGLGQPLLVRPAAKGRGGYEIVEGSRRWRAIGVLIAAGDWDERRAIPCLLRELTDAEALELSLSTSLTRLPLGPAEEAIAFARMDKSDAEIALAFGIPERRVAQRRAIGTLAVPILDALAAGEITLEVAQAFTLTPDVKRQVKLWKEFNGQGNRTADWVRRMLTDKAVPGDSREARLVGEEAYLAAGGTIRRDLFGADVWFEDGPLLHRLFDEKLASITSGLVAEGWGFVTITEPNDPRIFWRGLTPKNPPSADDAKRLKQIEREQKAIARPYGEDANWTRDDTAKYQALEDEREAIAAKGFTEKQRRASGVILYVDHDGLQILRGRVAPSKPAKGGRSAAPGLDPGAHGDTGDSDTPPRRRDEEPDFTGQLLADLSGAMGGALQMTLVEKPGQALRLALAILITRGESAFGGELPFSLKSFNYAAPSPAHEAYRAILAEILRDAEGRDFAETLDRLDDLDEDAHHKLLAILLANALDWPMHPQAAHKALVRRLDPDCARWFRPDEAFFNRLKKPQLLDALAEADATDAEARRGRKKPELVARCLEVLPPLGWLPAPLRAPCYTGPGSEAYALAQAEAIASRSSSPLPSVGEGDDAQGASSGEGVAPQLAAAE